MEISVDTKRKSLEFCFQGSDMHIFIEGDEIRIAEAITYEVAIGEQFAKLQLAIKGGKVYLVTPFGRNEVSNPENLIQGVKQILDGIKESHKELYEEMIKILG
ncbi:hypothetical protein [Acidianus sp. RZ1]|uniref:hypothetical protein n=1 Tax=Acidianus sp. RZ1 TaxID=1540082 RepID=UPI001490B9E1|nr:hypothetical protein [Acidianus sp. RZ1]NON63188.1 hypothetical protein [Acidianus sp. RZ1]